MYLPAGSQPPFPFVELLYFLTQLLYCLRKSCFTFSLPKIQTDNLRGQVCIATIFYFKSDTSTFWCFGHLHYSVIELTFLKASHAYNQMLFQSSVLSPCNHDFGEQWSYFAHFLSQICHTICFPAELAKSSLCGL